MLLLLASIRRLSRLALANAVVLLLPAHLRPPVAVDAVLKPLAGQLSARLLILPLVSGHPDV